MSKEQIDYKVKCVQEMIDRIADEIQEFDKKNALYLKAQVMNLACIRGDIEQNLVERAG